MLEDAPDEGDRTLETRPQALIRFDGRKDDSQAVITMKRGQTASSHGKAQRRGHVPKQPAPVFLSQARQAIHKAVRQASRKCDIAYEYADGSVEYDEIEDPLPYDLEADVVEIADEDFGIFYLDCNQNPDRYDGKTVKFTAQVCLSPRAGKGAFVPGRFAMTCCVQDIQFVGFPCKYEKCDQLTERSWITLTAKLRMKYHPLYRGEGPVLTAVEVGPAQAPADDVVTFS